MFGFGVKPTMVSPADAPPGRPTPLPGLPDRHEVLGTSLRGPWETGSGPAHVLYLAFGCFWGAERIMWKVPGVVSTAAGYMGGYTPNPTYDEVCSGRTGHAETVLVAYDPAIVDAAALLKVFWENHDPTQGMRQGNDVGTQYRSAAYWTTSEQEDAVRRTAAAFEKVLVDNGNRPPTTELKPAGDEQTSLATEQSAGAFFYAEDYHQQYLHKNPAGYCSHGPNGLICPVA